MSIWKVWGAVTWSDHCKDKLKILLDKLRNQHEDLTVLGLKRVQNDINLDGYWYRDNRGTNAFKNKQAIAALELPESTWE